MTAHEALLMLLGELRAQISALADENAALKQQLVAALTLSEDSDAAHLAQ